MILTLSDDDFKKSARMWMMMVMIAVSSSISVHAQNICSHGDLSLWMQCAEVLGEAWWQHIHDSMHQQYFQTSCLGYISE